MSDRDKQSTVTSDRPMPLRMKPRTIAVYLDTGYDTVLDLIHRGIFTTFDNGKRGLGRRIHVPTEEVQAYASGGEDAVREMRAKKKRAKR